MAGVNFSNAQGTGVVTADGFATRTAVITFNPPSLSTGAFAVSSGITVDGVAIGDAIDLFAPYDTQGVIYQASPSAAGTIKISLINCSGATVDLPSGDWGVAVRRRA